jgi:hypothetical protein
MDGVMQINDPWIILDGFGGDKGVFVRAQLVKFCHGNASTAIFLAQLLYWSRRTKNPDGWVYNTAVEYTEQTGLSDGVQTTARAKLLAHKLIEEDKRGMPCTVHIRVNAEKLAEMLVSGECLSDNRDTTKASSSRKIEEQVSGTSSSRKIEEQVSGTSGNKFQDVPGSQFQDDRETTPYKSINKIIESSSRTASNEILNDKSTVTPPKTSTAISLSQMDGEQKNLFSRASGDVKTLKARDRILQGGLELFLRLCDLKDVAGASDPVWRTWLRDVDVMLEQHGYDHVLASLEITLSNQLEKPRMAYQHFKKVAVSPRFENTQLQPPQPPATTNPNMGEAGTDWIDEMLAKRKALETEEVE